MSRDGCPEHPQGALTGTAAPQQQPAHAPGSVPHAGGCAVLCSQSRQGLWRQAGACLPPPHAAMRHPTALQGTPVGARALGHAARHQGARRLHQQAPAVLSHLRYPHRCLGDPTPGAERMLCTASQGAPAPALPWAGSAVQHLGNAFRHSVWYTRRNSDAPHPTGRGALHVVFW
jgi:hypothetical protein